jgi:hypothetical protein
MPAQVRLVAARRQKFGIDELDMRCDDVEIPEFWQVRRADSYWVAAHAEFDGLVGPEGDQRQHHSLGTAAMAVLGQQVAVIVSPDDTSVPALWINFDRLADVRVAATGETGMIRKRPKRFEVHLAGGRLDVTDVSQLLRSSGTYKAGQELAFAKLFT